MKMAEAIDLLREMLKCKNEDCDPRLCGECDLCQRKRDEIDEAWNTALVSLEALENIKSQIKNVRQSIVDETGDWIQGYKCALMAVEQMIVEIEKGGSE